jgi:transposase-like protein
MTINLSKFEIAKNENDELFLKSNGKLIMVYGAIKLDVRLNVFIAEHKSKTYAFISACYVDCSKFNSKFNNMIKPVFSTIKKTVKTKTMNSSNNDLIEQLEQLNSLFKSGVLTKEEFEKAKKKILN